MKSIYLKSNDVYMYMLYVFLVFASYKWSAFRLNHVKRLTFVYIMPVSLRMTFQYTHIHSDELGIPNTNKIENTWRKISLMPFDYIVTYV